MNPSPKLQVRGLSQPELLVPQRPRTIGENPVTRGIALESRLIPAGQVALGGADVVGDDGLLRVTEAFRVVRVEVLTHGSRIGDDGEEDDAGEHDDPGDGRQVGRQAGHEAESDDPGHAPETGLVLAGAVALENAVVDRPEVARRRAVLHPVVTHDQDGEKAHADGRHENPRRLRREGRSEEDEGDKAETGTQPGILDERHYASLGMRESVFVKRAYRFIKTRLHIIAQKAHFVNPQLPC